MDCAVAQTASLCSSVRKLAVCATIVSYYRFHYNRTRLRGRGNLAPTGLVVLASALKCLLNSKLDYICFNKDFVLAARLESSKSTV